MTPMLVQCSSCLTEFELDPDKVPAAGVRARCSVCSAVITVPAPPKQAATHPSPERHDVPEPPVEAIWQAPEPTPAPAVAEQRHAPQAQRPEAAAPAAAAPAAEPTAAPPAARPPVAAAVYVEQQAPQQESRPAWSAPKIERAPAAAAPAPAEADSGQRRPINPFLTRDPALRAKRLARALVSDIVAYHPARHAEGLRDGTLKTLFRDEIKKSYEEYVDQVGRDFASSTTHFQDALNDVLASGKKLF